MSDLNDQAFSLLKDQKWAEAAAAAKSALALDGASSAAWFNLGRAQLGQKQYGDAVVSFTRASELSTGNNSDVEYNRGRALWLAGKKDAALQAVKQALAKFPRDPDFQTLLGQIQGAPGTSKVDDRTWQADLYGDGTLATFTLKENGKTSVSDHQDLVVTNSKGEVLFQGSPAGQRILRLRMLQMPDGARLAHIEWDGCPAYPQNQVLWYDPATKAVRDLSGKGDMCASWTYQGNGNFATFYRLYYPVAGVVDNHWEHGKLVGTGSALVIYAGVNPYTLDATLTDIAARPEGEVQGTENLFASPDIYRQFRASFAPMQAAFRLSGDREARPIKLSVTMAGKPGGTLSVTLAKGKDGSEQITALDWSR